MDDVGASDAAAGAAEIVGSTDAGPDGAMDDVGASDAAAGGTDPEGSKEGFWLTDGVSVVDGESVPAGP